MKWNKNAYLTQTARYIFHLRKRTECDKMTKRLNSLRQTDIAMAGGMALGREIVSEKRTDRNNAAVINHIPEDRFLFSVLGTDNDSFYEAIMEHFFDIRYFYKEEGNFIDFDFEDNTNWNVFKGVNVVYVAQDYLNNLCFHDQFENMLTSLLERGYQVLVPVDICYIGAYDIQGCHFSHTLHISGAGRDKEEYYCQDFFRGRYCMKRIPERDILEAVCNYWKLRYRNAQGQENCTGLAALKRKQEYAYVFRPRVFQQRMENMLYMDPAFRTSSLGLGIFDAIIETQSNEIPFWRPSSTRKFYEFMDDNMELMKYRLSYLRNCKDGFGEEEFLIKCCEIQKFCRQNRKYLAEYEIRHHRRLIVDKDETVKDMTAPLLWLKEEVISLFGKIQLLTGELF